MPTEVEIMHGAWWRGSNKVCINNKSDWTSAD